eukprot:scaffold18699_cov175-Isochrysis_galbana.AAC.3
MYACNSTAHHLHACPPSLCSFFLHAPHSQSYEVLDFFNCWARRLSAMATSAIRAETLNVSCERPSSRCRALSSSTLPRLGAGGIADSG